MKHILLTLILCTSASAETLNVPISYPTIQTAVLAAKPGDTITLAPGTYVEEVTWRYAQGGTEAQPITLDGTGATLAGRLSFYKPRWTVKNLTIAGWTQWRQWLALVEFYPGAHFTRVENVKLDAAGTIYIDGFAWRSDGASRVPFPPEVASDCLITGCEIKHIKGYTGCSMMGNRNVFRGNVMKDFIQSDFVRVFGDGNTIAENTFDGNRVSPPDEPIGFHADFIQTFGSNGHGSRNHLIDRNVIKNVEGQICQFEENALTGTGAMGNWTISNNLFMDITLSASITLSNVKWTNNTFVRCAPGHVLNMGNGPRGSSDGHQIFNNVFLDCGTKTGYEQGWYGDGTVDLVNYQPVKFTADNNYVSKNNFGPMRSDAGRAIFRFTEPNGINGGDPLMVDIAGGDFHLKAGSPLIGKGVAGVDIGAFAYVAAPVDPPPVDPTPEPPLPQPDVLYRYRVTIDRSTDGATWEPVSQSDLLPK